MLDVTVWARDFEFYQWHLRKSCPLGSNIYCITRDLTTKLFYVIKKQLCPVVTGFLKEQPDEKNLFIHSPPYPARSYPR